MCDADGTTATMKENDVEVVHVKWDHYGSFRRFSILRCTAWNFSEMLDKVLTIDPAFSGSLGYIDDDGDCVLLGSEFELKELLELSIARGDKVLRIKSVFTENGVEMVERPKDSPIREIHKDIMCNICDRMVKGIRYKCDVCFDYDLCENCEKTGAHSEHAMIRLANPRTYWKNSLDTRHRLGHTHRSGHHDRNGQSRAFNPMVINKAIQNAKLPQPNSKSPSNSEKSFSKRIPNYLQTQKIQNVEKPDLKSIDFLKGVGVAVQQALTNFGIDVDTSIEHNNKLEKISCPIKETTPIATVPTVPFAEPAAPTTFELKPNPELPFVLYNENSTEKVAQEVADKTAKEMIEEITNDVLKKTEEIVDLTFSTVNKIAENPQTKVEVDRFLQNASQVTQFAINQTADIVRQNSSYMIANVENPQVRSIMSSVSQWADQLSQLYPGNNQQETPNTDNDQKINPIVESVSLNVDTVFGPNENTVTSISKEAYFKDVKTVTNVEIDRKSSETRYDSDDSDVEIISTSPHSTPPPQVIAPAQTKNSSLQDLEHMFQEDEGWTLMNNSNYEAMCKFYESKRKVEEAKCKQLEQIKRQMEQAKLLMKKSAMGVEDVQEFSQLAGQLPVNLSHLTPPPETVELSEKTTENAQNSTQPSAPIYTGNISGDLYPLLGKDECSAGIPYPSLPYTIRPHTKICSYKHKNPIVQNAVEKLEGMGYDNCNGWLTRLSEKCNGDISMILDETAHDPIHSAHLG